MSFLRTGIINTTQNQLLHRTGRVNLFSQLNWPEPDNTDWTPLHSLFHKSLSIAPDNSPLPWKWFTGYSMHSTMIYTVWEQNQLVMSALCLLSNWGTLWIQEHTHSPFKQYIWTSKTPKILATKSQIFQHIEAYSVSSVTLTNPPSQHS